MRSQLGEHDRRRDIRRHAHDDERRRLLSVARAAGAVVDREVQVGRRCVVEHDIHTARAEAEADAGAEQPGADDADGSGEPG